MKNEIIIGTVAAVLASAITYFASIGQNTLSRVQTKELAIMLKNDDAFTSTLLDDFSKDSRFIPKDRKVGLAVVGIPSGAVLAFDLSNCPSGWSEYTPAYGRFVRGIDRGNPKTDPDGTRTLGDLQEDQMQAHKHRVAGGTVQSFSFIPQSSDYYAPTIGKGAIADNYPETTAPVNIKTGNETRPKNVSLLYCEKDKTD